MMKLFRREKVKSLKDTNNNPHATRPTVSLSAPERTDSSRRDTDALRIHQQSPNSSSNSISDTNVTKKHNIRIGDTRFHGRILFRARALYDYPIDGDTLHIEDEEIKLLRFKKGDLINVYEQDPSGWWAGEHNNEKGIFPGSYMKVMEEEEESPKHPKHKSKDISKDELLRKVNDLEKKSEILLDERNNIEKIKAEIEKKCVKSEYELSDIFKKLKEKEELAAEQALKINQLETELEDSSTRLSAKEVEVLTLELEIQDYRQKAEQDVKIRQLQEEKEQKVSLLKDIDGELNSKRNELNEVIKLRQEIEKSLNDAQTKLTRLETQRTTVTPSGEDFKDIKEMERQLELIKKQLGEEVLERRKAENEFKEYKKTHTMGELENLSKENFKLKEDLKTKLELEQKLSKINLILQGLIHKEDSQLSIPMIKEIMNKIRKGIANDMPKTSGGSTLNAAVPPPTQESVRALMHRSRTEVKK